MVFTPKTMGFLQMFPYTEDVGFKRTSALVEHGWTRAGGPRRLGTVGFVRKARRTIVEVKLQHQVKLIKMVLNFGMSCQREKRGQEWRAARLPRTIVPLEVPNGQVCVDYPWQVFSFPAQQRGCRGSSAIVTTCWGCFLCFLPFLFFLNQFLESKSKKTLLGSLDLIT